MPDEKRFLVKTERLPFDRIKDEIVVLIKKYSENKRTIVSFLLSTLLNNIKKKQGGYTLFNQKNTSKPLKLIDLALYIYAFYPSFDQTRKVISIISYINNEIDFINNETSNAKLNQTINSYSFIFRSGNIFDLCDWFPFFREYNIILDVQTENQLIQYAEKYNDPIIWGNILQYSRYYEPFFNEVRDKIESNIKKQLYKLSDKEPMMQVEFWYVLIYHNCPFISQSLREEMSDLINKIKNSCNPKPSGTITKLVCEFLEQQSPNGNKKANSLFNWNEIKNFGDQITYRTYQRTLFKNYRKNSYWPDASVD